MKTGVENRKVMVAAIVFAALALIFVVRMFLTLNEQPGTSAAPTSSAQKAPQARRIRGAAQAKLPATNSLDPTLHTNLMKASEETEYKGSGRNIFAKYEPPPPKAPDPRLDHGPKGPPPPQCPGDPRCPPPPIPLKFYGFASKPGEPKKIFLTSAAGDVFIAAEGEVVDRRYRVLKIGVNSVEIEDVLSNSRQTIPLTQG